MLRNTARSNNASTIERLTTMARHKQIRTCFKCKAQFTWERVNNAVRQVNYPQGDFHYCKDYNSETGTRTNETIGAQVRADNLESTQQSQSEQSKTETMLEEGKNRGLGVTDIKSDSIQVTSEVVTEPIKPIENLPVKSDAGKTLYDLVQPFVIEDIHKHAGSAKQSIVTTHVVQVNKADSVITLTGCHRQQAELIDGLALGFNMLLVGPAGTGKTTAAFNASTALGLDYFPVSLGPQTSKSDFFGFTDAHGIAVWTVVRKAFINGGILLMDEIDASGAGALTYVNAILANSHAAFPSDKGDLVVSDKHPDFRVIAAANTYGHGGNRMYVGRQQLDAATLDRFVGIDWEYDTDLEQAIAGKQLEYLMYIWKLRKTCDALGIRAVFGTRKVIHGVKALNAGWDMARVNRSIVFFGISADDRAKLERGR